MKYIHHSLVLLLLLLLLYGCRTLKIERSEAANLRLDTLVTVPSDPSIEKLIQPYRQTVDADMAEVLCNSAEAIYSGKPESPLTNLCADIILAESNQYCKDKNLSVRMDLSMVNRGGLRITLPKGAITTRTMFELMPFENEIVFLKLKGDVVLQFIQHLAKRGGEGISGVRFGISDGKAIYITLAGNSVETGKFYWLVTSDYIANGGDGSEILTQSAERIDTGIKARDQFIGYFRKEGKAGTIITAKTDGRIYNAK